LLANAPPVINASHNTMDMYWNNTTLRN